jgi:hypothetical protein
VKKIVWRSWIRQLKLAAQAPRQPPEADAGGSGNKIRTLNPRPSSPGPVLMACIVQLRNAGHQRQANAAAAPAVARNTVKAPEDRFVLRLRNTGAVVGHFQADMGFAVFSA